MTNEFAHQKSSKAWIVKACSQLEQNI